MKPDPREVIETKHREAWDNYTGQDSRPLWIKLLELAACGLIVLLFCLLVRYFLP